MLNGKRILLIVGGGIAAYRALELARLMIKQGARVRCVPTKAACAFVTPLSFEALTGEPAHTALFDLTAEREMGHIRLAREADAIVLAPATADRLAKTALGLADDLAGAVLLAAECPLLMAPAMNAAMWRKPAIQRHMDALCARGVAFIGPEEGLLACGEEGPGRMSEPAAILDALHGLLAGRPLAGRRWLVNAGPTWERWDDARILTNRASGRLGAEIAREAALLGASVHLVAGPGTPEAGPAARTEVESAEEMRRACLDLARAQAMDCFIASAAVSDYRIARPIRGKHKRQAQERLTLELVRNPDIVAEIAAPGAHRPRRVIAFAAEAEDIREHARKKLAAKGADAIIANAIGNMGKARADGRDLAAWWIDRHAEIELRAADKRGLARAIVAQAAKTPQNQ